MTPKELVLNWLDAFNQGDALRISSLYSVHAENHQVALEPVKGKEEIQKMFIKEFAAAKMVCIPINLFEDGEWAILEWTDPKGLQGCGFFHVVNDEIIFQRGYWDKISFHRLYDIPL